MAGWAEESFLSGPAAAAAAAGCASPSAGRLGVYSPRQGSGAFFFCNVFIVFQFLSFLWTPQATERHGPAVHNTACLPTLYSARLTPHPVAGPSLPNPRAASRADQRCRRQEVRGGVGGGRGATPAGVQPKRVTRFLEREPVRRSRKRGLGTHLVLPRENGSVVLTLGSAKLDPAEPFPVERSSGATRPERAPLSQVQVRPKPRTHAVVLVPALAPALAPPRRWTVSTLQPFSQKSLTATVPKVFQIGGLLRHTRISHRDCSAWAGSCLYFLHASRAPCRHLIRRLLLLFVSWKERPHTAVLPKIPHCHCHCCKRVSNRPLRPRRGRFGILLALLQSGIFGRTAVAA